MCRWEGLGEPECGPELMVGGAARGVHACVCVCVRVWRGDSITVMGKLDFFFSCGEEKEDGGQLRGSVMAPHHILCMYRWKKTKMFSQ